MRIYDERKTPRMLWSLCYGNIAGMLLAREKAAGLV